MTTAGNTNRSDLDTPTEVAAAPPPVPSPSLVRSKGLWIAAVATAIVVASGAFGLWKHQSRPTHPLRSLAVLPFANLSGDAELDLLADAISSGLITSLREFEGLQVVGRTESWNRRDTSLETLRRELAVGAVVNGEIQQNGPDLRNTVSLTDTSTGFVLWSHTYSAAADQAYRTQRSIARDLATYLSIPLTASDRRRLAEKPDGSHAAYDYFVTGQRFLDSGEDPRSPDSAAENFRQALRIKPNFVLAHVGLAEALWQIYYLDGDRSTLAEAEAAAETACRIDPDAPTAQVALARILRTTGRQDAAIELGDSAQLIRHEDEFQALRTHPEFIALVE